MKNESELTLKSKRQLKTPKSKLVSILIAVFLSFFTWIYTYNRNGWKFWLGFALSGIPLLTAAVFLEFYISDISWLPDDLLIFLSYALPMAVWAWAILDSAIKSREWYAGYYA
jgi:hypothetical protein